MLILMGTLIGPTNSLCIGLPLIFLISHSVYQYLL
jgi:hypothetical protein